MSVYIDCLHVTERYLGEKARDYLARRFFIATGLKDSNQLTREHLPKLLWAIEATVTVYFSEE